MSGADGTSGGPTFRQRIASYYFRKLVRYCQPGEYHRVQSLRGLTSPKISIPELLYLRWGIRVVKPQTVVEIGSYCGASTSIIADVIKTLGQGRVYAIDFFSNPPQEMGYEDGYEQTFDRTMRPYAGWFEKIKGDSTRITWDRAIDVLFIDGDHRRQGLPRTSQNMPRG